LPMPIPKAATIARSHSVKVKEGTGSTVL
jgi:hypothetical protein